MSSFYCVASYSSLASNIDVSSIWEIWKDVPNWPQWDHTFQKTAIDGDFEVGSKIIIYKKQNDYPIILRICNLLENEIFDTESEMPFGKVSVKRKIEEMGDKTKLTHSFNLQPKDEKMKIFFDEKIAPTVHETFKNAVENIMQIAMLKS